MLPVPVSSPPHPERSHSKAIASATLEIRNMPQASILGLDDEVVVRLKGAMDQVIGLACVFVFGSGRRVNDHVAIRVGVQRREVHAVEQRVVLELVSRRE